MLAFGNAFTATVTAAEVAEHPFPSVTVTAKVPDVATVILEVIELSDHRYEFPAPALSVTEPPWQKVRGPFAEILAVGNALTVTFTIAEVAEQPFPSVTVTAKLPDEVTTILEVTALSDHK